MIKNNVGFLLAVNLDSATDADYGLFFKGYL